MKKILIISSFFLILISTSTIGYKIVSANEKIEEIKDPIIKQEEQESYLTPYGYTIDNPNVVLDPYDVSPLTALILFETEKEEAVTIIVEGKDQNSTYKNTFQSTTKHSIPIYGLYPNSINKVHISCGDKTKTIEIKTSPLPSDLSKKEVINNTNDLYFITSDTYPYALDNNNEIRWYLTKNYSKKITTLQNGHLLLSTDTKNKDQSYTGLLEIDLLGKIYKQYNIENGYYGSYAETTNSLFILSDSILELDKQTGTILNTFPLNSVYNEVFYLEESNTISLLNQKEIYNINLKTKEKNTLPNESPLKNEQEIILPVYNTEEEHKQTKSVKFTTNTPTPKSNKNIFLIGYKKIDDNYKKHNITITKTSDNIQVVGNFSKKEEVYLILDKFLDKRIYDITSNYTIINKEGLSGKYSIYIKINNTIYRTNTYVTI